MHPIHYRLCLEPDLRHFRFYGTVEISFDHCAGAREVHLNILDLAIRQCRVKNGQDMVSCPFRVHPDKEALIIELPEAESEARTIEILFFGEINDRMAGFYRSAYHRDGRTHYIAVSQFQESDARRAFPCQDHPARKATFDVTLIVGESDRAVSNEDVERVEPVGDGRKRVVFRRTPKMSTYLLFFGVGDFRQVQHSEDPRVRALTIPGMQAHAGFGLSFGEKALAYCEAYYGIPYPLQKLDLLAIPDFAFGAMENWGAITFRENLLLQVEGKTSRSGTERICEVIAHEIAHQWFGNLVTPSDWRYLWLNESFATYFGFGAVDHYYPSWDIWSQFISSQTETALERDAHRETFAIEIPGGEHVVINSSTAPIIYSKGGSVLRQLKGYIGESDFQAGLRSYLKTYAYGNADSRQFWEAFDAVSGKKVSAMMQPWVEQPGYPVIRVERAGDTLHLFQRRFTYLASSDDAVWPVPIRIRFFGPGGVEEVQTVLLEDRQMTITVPEGMTGFKINDGQTGFYRVHYRCPEDFQDITQRIRSGTISPEDRWGIQNDAYAFVRSGDMDFQHYLDLLPSYAADHSFLPLSGIAGNLSQASLVLAGPGGRRAGRELLRFSEETLVRIGMTPTDEEIMTRSILREQLIWNAVATGSIPVTAAAAGHFETLLTGGSIPSDLQKSVMQSGAWIYGEKAMSWLLERLASSESEHERMNILLALGCFRETDLLKEALDYTLEKVPQRNRFIPIVAVAHHPSAISWMWDWLIEHLPKLETFHPLLFERVLGAVVPYAGMAAPEEVRSFLADYQLRKGLTDIIRLSLERLDINLRMRQRCSEMQ